MARERGQRAAAQEASAQQAPQVAQAGNTPVVAIGGIDLHNAAEVLAAGAASLAVVRAVTEAADPAAAVKAFQALWA